MFLKVVSSVPVAGGGSGSGLADATGIGLSDCGGAWGSSVETIVDGDEVEDASNEVVELGVVELGAVEVAPTGAAASHWQAPPACSVQEIVRIPAATERKVAKVRPVRGAYPSTGRQCPALTATCSLLSCGFTLRVSF